MSNNVLITGSAGFIGSHLTEKLVKDGYNVRAFLHYNSRNSWGWLENSDVKNDIEVISGDVRDYDVVYDSMKGVDSVFHLAALIGIPYSYVSPHAYIQTNINGTHNVVHAAKKLETENVLVTSTSETYGTAQFVPISEQHPLVGQSPYSATKIAADQIALSFNKSFDVPVKIVRPFNTYGPRQSARAIIPTIISQLLSGTKQLKLGNLTPTRDLTFVEDTVSGFIEISKTPELNGEFTNIGMKEEISIGELVKLIVKIVGVDAEIVTDKQRVRPKNSEVERLFCDNTKIIEKTNWRPSHNLEQGLTKTVEWFNSHLDIYKPEIYNT